MRTRTPSAVTTLVLCLAFSTTAELRAGSPSEDGTSSPPPSSTSKRATDGTKPVPRRLRASASASGSMSASASGGAAGSGRSPGNGGIMSNGQSGVSGTMALRVALSTDDDEDVEQQKQPYVPGGPGDGDASPDEPSVVTRVEGGRRITTIEREGETVTITDSPSRIVVHRLDRNAEPPESGYVAATTPRALQAKDPAAYALYDRYVVQRAAGQPARGVASQPLDRLLDDILANAP